MNLPTEAEPVRVETGDCLDVLPSFPAGAFDSVVTDPPAAISFMGRSWDTDKGGRAEWVGWLRVRLAEALRVTKPGGRLLCWAIPRRSHWTALAVEDAGWVIEDKVYHLFGTGFPKAKSKLKPAAEEWILARSPGPIRDLNIDGCRVPTTDRFNCAKASSGYSGIDRYQPGDGRQFVERGGRWPAHLTHDGSDEVLGAFAAFGERRTNATGPRGVRKGGRANAYGDFAGDESPRVYGSDTGTAARFFYCAKASKAERGEGNRHPTVKPLALMRWLVRLVTPPGGAVLDPFCGSGTTLVAAVQEGFRAVGIDSDAEPGSCATARRRVAEVMGDSGLLAGAV